MDSPILESSSAKSSLSGQDGRSDIEKELNQNHYYSRVMHDTSGEVVPREQKQVQVIEEEEEEDDDDDSTEEPDEDKSLELSSASSEGISPEKADLLLIKATGLKEGNKEFKEGDLDKAARAYRRGVNSLKKLNLNDGGDEQVKALLVTLYTNLSTVSFKNKKYRVSSEVANQALQLEKTNVKALFRRAVANRKLGNLEDSRSDLRAAIAVDATNSACKKELLAVKKELESAKENQKKALAKAFSNGKGGTFLYEDMEEAAKKAAKKKQDDEQRQKIEEEELSQKRKVHWEDECVKLMTNNKPVITFEEWDKQRVERDEQERKRKDKETAARRKAERKASIKTAKANDKDDESDDDDKLTESELAMMRGYKKTADGRTTSYFTRELSEEEKLRIGDIAPKRLDENTISLPCNNNITPALMNQADVTPATASVWNQAGTWEEKDTTEWCKSQLRARLEETIVFTETFDVDITEVDELTGDASVAVVSCKKRYIFDFHVKLKYEIKRTDESNLVVGSGVVRLPDICSTHHDEIEVDFCGWKKRPKPDALEVAMTLRDSLADQLRINVQKFVQDFNDMY